MPEKVRHIQSSFAAGAIAPEMYGRVELEQYARGLKTCKNFIVKPHGSVVNRPGFKFVCEVKDTSKDVRLLPFRFSTTQTYILEFGDYYMRVIMDGGLVVEDPKTITSTTAADPVVVTATAHGYEDGDKVYISGVEYANELNGRWFTVANKAANTFELEDEDGSGYEAGVGGEAEREYVLDTPYGESELSGLGFTQSADTMTLVHRNWTPRELTRTDHDAWSLDPITFLPTISKPQGLSAGSGGAYTYAVTAINEENGEESLAAIVSDSDYTPDAGKSISWTAVTGASGYNVYRDDGGSYRKPGFVGTTTTNQFVDPGNTTNTNALEPEWSISPPEHLNPFSDADNQLTITDITQANPGVVTTSTAHGYSNGDMVFIDDSVGGMVEVHNTWYTVTVVDADEFSIGVNTSGYTAYTADGLVEKLDGNGNCPGAVTYYEQRLCFGGTDNNPQKTWMSQSAAFHNMSSSRPLRDSDSIVFTIAAREVNVIENLVPMRDLILLTAGGEWRANGGESEQMTATGGLAVRQQTTYGSGSLPAITIGNVTIYYQDRGPALRTIAYAFSDDQYMGVDLSILSQHLLEGYSLTEWTYAQAPYSVIWCRRSDGELIGLTYQHEHKVWAWHEHDTQGLFVSCAAILEDAEDRLYVATQRIINGTTTRFIERSHERYIDNVRDAFFVDAGASLDNPVTITGITAAEPPVVTAADHGLSMDSYVDISDVIAVTTEDGRTTYSSHETNDHQYMATWVLAAAKTITDITQAKPAVVTSNAHGYSNGDRVYIQNVGGMTQVNDREFTVANQAANTFELLNEDSTGHDAYTLGGTAKKIDPDTFYLCDTDTDYRGLSAATQANPVQITTTNPHGYSTGDVVYLYDIGGMVELDDRWFTITVVDTTNFTLDGEDGTGHTAYTSGGAARSHAEDGTGYSTYSSGGEMRKAFTTIGNAWHLEGAACTVLANGLQHPLVTVSDGTITLEYPASRVHVGLAYTATLETLKMEMPLTREGTRQGTPQTISELILRVHDSVGFWAGGSTDNMYEQRWRQDEAYDQPLTMFTGDTEPLFLMPDWGRGASVVITQPDPFPLNINAIIAEVQIGR